MLKKVFFWRRKKATHVLIVKALMSPFNREIRKLVVTLAERIPEEAVLYFLTAVLEAETRDADEVTRRVVEKLVDLVDAQLLEKGASRS